MGEEKIMTIGERIKNRRAELNLTYEEIGKTCDVSKSTVRKWETGMIENMKSDKIVLLAKALQVSPAELLGWDACESEKVVEKSSYCDIKTITAHVDGEPLTEEEQKEVLDFARYILSKRKNK